MPNRIAAMDARMRSACYPQSTFYLLSDGLSIQNRRITKPDFRLCSTNKSHSQAPFYLCAQCLIANQAEGTFELLRYSFGGDRPSQTAQLTMSVALIQGTTLELKHSQAGISRTTRPTLARRLHSLPAILHKIYLRPISAYSKGSWGLSV